MERRDVRIPLPRDRRARRHRDRERNRHLRRGRRAWTACLVRRTPRSRRRLDGSRRQGSDPHPHDVMLETADVLPNLLARRAHETPERVYARQVDGSTWTYLDLERDTRLWAGRLRALGVEAGDRVVVMLPNRLTAVAVWLAVARLGAIEVPVNTRLPRPLPRPPRQQLRGRRGRRRSGVSRPLRGSRGRNPGPVQPHPNRPGRGCHVRAHCSRLDRRARPDTVRGDARAGGERHRDDSLHVGHHRRLEGRSRHLGADSTGPRACARHSKAETRTTSSTRRSPCST